MNKKNVEIYEETMQLIASMKLFKVIMTEGEKYQIINDFQLACAYAFDYEEFCYRNEDGYMWSDIKSNIFAEVKDQIYELDNYKEINQAIRELKLITLSEVIMSKEAEKVFNEIHSDLMICMRTRVITGKENKFFEDILDAYFLGGWPCGWFGNYPDGKLIVYCPE
ncbi:MAG: hypothetical protein AB9856_06745 [Cellulosilyticaceae bacterium]